MDPETQILDRDRAGRLTLLIADDDPVVRSMLSMGLDQRFEVIAAVEDSQEAVMAAVALRPHVAVIDVNMPGGGGERAVRGIAEMSPDTAIVVLSGDEEDSVVRDLLQAGAMSYCRKGIPPQELAAILESSVEAVRQQRTTRAAASADR